MLKMTLEADLRLIGDFVKFREKVRDKVVKTGLDDLLDKSLEELKQRLKYFVNEEIRNVAPTKDSDTIENPKINLPKSQEEILKYFTGIDMDKIRKTKDWTSSVESNVVLYNNYRVNARFPIGPFESVDENYAKAVKFFNSSIFVFVNNGQVEYYINPGIDLTPYVKIVCSRERGVTEKSSSKFEKYKNSNKMTRQEDSSIGRYAEWSLAKEGTQVVRSRFINITEAIDKIREGNYEEAISLFKRYG